MLYTWLVVSFTIINSKTSDLHPTILVSLRLEISSTCPTSHINFTTTSQPHIETMSRTPSPAMHPNPKSLISFFSRSIAAFQSSNDAYRVLCTLPHRTSTPAPRRPTAALQDLVILDSSFNPPTRAHAEMARTALGGVKGDAKRLVLLLAVNNADKAAQPASFEVRLGMMEGFGREFEGEVEVDVAVTTVPFFHEKSRAVRESGFYAAPSQPEQTFLAGFDTLIRIFNPKYYRATPAMQQALRPFFEAAKLRVTMRPDDAWGGVEEQKAYMEGLRSGELESVGGDAEWARRVVLVDGWGKGVSSSRVRDSVRRGEEGLDALVGGEVRGWIEREGLYRDEGARM